MALADLAFSISHVMCHRLSCLALWPNALLVVQLDTYLYTMVQLFLWYTRNNLTADSIVLCAYHIDPLHLKLLKRVIGIDRLVKGWSFSALEKKKRKMVALKRQNRSLLAINEK